MKSTSPPDRNVGQGHWCFVSQAKCTITQNQWLLKTKDAQVQQLYFIDPEDSLNQRKSLIRDAKGINHTISLNTRTALDDMLRR